MKRALCLLAVALVACQTSPSNRGASRGGTYVDRFYVQDASGGPIVELNWSGIVLGSVAATGFDSPSSDGSKFLRNSDHPAVDDWQGHTIAPLNEQLSQYGSLMWADDNTHLCGVAIPATAGPGSDGSLWIATTDGKFRTVGAVGMPDAHPAVQACSLAGNRVVIAAGDFPHWPPQAERHLITTQIEVLNASDGKVEYRHAYPPNNVSAQFPIGAPPGTPPPPWILVTPSPDGRYLAETGVFTNTTSIRDVTTGNIVASVAGRAIGFASGGAKVVVDTQGASNEVEVVNWTTGHVSWRRTGNGQAVLARPHSADLLVGVVNAAGTIDLYVVSKDTGRLVAKNVSVPWMSPAYPGV